MKKFREFVNESVNITQPEIVENVEFDNFINQVKEALIKDFNNTEEQVEEFLELYIDVLEDSFDNDFTPREAIASTKIPGVKLTNENMNESLVLNIDNEYEQTYDMILNSDNLQSILECENVMENYYNKYKNKSYSDIRIFERIKNNHKNLVKMLKDKRKEL
jgi:hypothetical protein